MPTGHTVLIVEDEFLIATDVTLFLEENGWRVLGPALTVAEALQLLAAERPTVGLLDIALRNETATVVAEALHRQNIPIVLMSAYTQPEHSVARVFAELPNIGKPVDQVELLKLLERAAGA